MKKNQTLKLTVTGMLIALEVILAFTPIGYLKIGLLSITFMTIPVIVGAVTNGLAVGTILGLTFGITSFVQCFGMDAFGTTLMSINPFATFVLCVCSRTLMGFFCALIYKLLSEKLASKIRKAEPVALGVSAFSAPFLNTAFFVPTLILFFWHSDYIQNIAEGKNVFAFLVGLVGVNGIVEWIACTAIGFAIAVPLKKALSKQRV